MSDLTKIFTAAPKSTFTLLAQAGLGYYIPAYQRPYSWKKVNTVDLIEDVVHGIAMLERTRGEAITFLGTMILMHDVKYQTVAPQVKGDLPNRVMLVIDGQQRITTLLLLNSALHNEIDLRIAALSKKSGESDFGLVWIRKKAQETLANLGMTLFQDMNYGEGEFRFYPRAIRAYEDTWARNPTDARYTSPIAYFLQKYGTHSRANSGKRFQLSVPEDGSYEVLEANWTTIRRQLQELAKGDKGDVDEMPQPTDIGVLAQEAIFQEQFPPEVVALVSGGGKSTAVGAELLRLVLFARYLLDRVAVTEVDATDEQYAFDIFESLNTTGEPLTSYDTFKPRVINAEGLATYRQSPSFALMAEIESYLSDYQSASDKHRATTQLLIPFASAETGKRLSKKLSDQRLFLKEEFDRCGNESERREFVRHLAFGAEFLRRVWPDDLSREADVPEFAHIGDEERRVTQFCIDVLRSSKHRITIGPLLRFYARFHLAPSTERKTAAVELAGAVRAMVAFMGLWRGSRSGTANIDQQYRVLLAKGFGSNGAFARRPDGQSGQAPTLERLQRSLRCALKDPDQGNIASKDAWVKRAIEFSTYDAREIVKLLLFAATNNSVVDDVGAGLIKAGKGGTLDMMTSARWRELTIEHIAPQKAKAKGWDPALYDVDSINNLGNLTLIPQSENSSLSARSWQEKKLIYRMLSTPFADQLEAQVAQAKELGVSISSGTEDVLTNARYHPQLEAIANVSADWSKSLVEARGTRLAELAWDQLVPWLGMSPSDAV